MSDPADDRPDDAPLTVDELAERYSFDDCCREAFEVARAAWLDGVDDPAAVAAALRHGTVILAFAEWATDAAERPGGLEGFATELESVSGTDGAAGPLLLALTAHDAGDVAAEDAALEVALARDPAAPVGCELAASIAAERGQLDRAIRLLQRAGARDDHEELRFLRALAGQLPSTRTTGRNDPCPCGSGRKFKACCLRNPVLAPEARAAWVLHRAARFAHAGPARFDLLDAALAVAAAEAGEPAGEDGDGEADGVDDSAVARHFGDPFTCDLLLFEGGVIDRYLAERGTLLADDELAWAEGWRDARRRLWDVTDVAEDGPVLVDRSSGEQVALAQRGSGCRVGDVVLARVTETAGAPRLGGTLMRIVPEQIEAVEALVDDGADLARWTEWYGRQRREAATG